MSRRWLPTKAAAPVIPSRVHWTSGRTRCLVRRRARPRYRRLCGAGEVEEVGALGVVELERPGECLQHALRGPAHVSPLQARVVRNAHAGEDGDLFAAEPGHAASCRRSATPPAQGVIRARREVRNSRISFFVSTRPSVDPAVRSWGTLPVALSDRDSHCPASPCFSGRRRGRDHSASRFERKACHEAHFSRRT